MVLRDASDRYLLYLLLGQRRGSVAVHLVQQLSDDGVQALTTPRVVSGVAQEQPANNRPISLGDDVLQGSVWEPFIFTIAIHPSGAWADDIGSTTLSHKIILKVWIML